MIKVNACAVKPGMDTFDVEAYFDDKDGPNMV